MIYLIRLTEMCVNSNKMYSLDVTKFESLKLI